jgi:hypothetical protein
MDKYLADVAKIIPEAMGVLWTATGGSCEIEALLPRLSLEHNKTSCFKTAASAITAASGENGKFPSLVALAPAALGSSFDREALMEICATIEGLDPDTRTQAMETAFLYKDRDFLSAIIAFYFRVPGYEDIAERFSNEGENLFFEAVSISKAAASMEDFWGLINPMFTTSRAFYALNPNIDDDKAITILKETGSLHVLLSLALNGAVSNDIAEKALKRVIKMFSIPKAVAYRSEVFLEFSYAAVVMGKAFASGVNRVIRILKELGVERNDLLKMGGTFGHILKHYAATTGMKGPILEGEIENLVAESGLVSVASVFGKRKITKKDAKEILLDKMAQPFVPVDPKGKMSDGAARILAEADPIWGAVRKAALGEKISAEDLRDDPFSKTERGLAIHRKIAVDTAMFFFENEKAAEAILSAREAVLELPKNKLFAAAYVGAIAREKLAERGLI